MADLFASRAPVRLNDGTADANNAAILNSAPSTDYGLVVRNIPSGTQTVDTELSAAAALADATANPTTALVGADIEIFNGTTWDRVRSVTNGLDSTGTGIQTSGIVGQLDDVATGTVTENQFSTVRISTRRALLVEGVTSGTNLNVNLAASAATVTVDSELPAAGALADATSNPTTTSVGAFEQSFNGTTWDRVRNTTASDGNTALTTTGILAAGVGPGFARRFNPANLATASNSVSAVDVNGAGTISLETNTATTGTFAIEVTVDGTTWVNPLTYDVGAATFVAVTGLTPTVGKIFISQVNGMRQYRLRTVSTLGATVAHQITISLGDAISYSSGSSTITGTVTVDSELPAAAALADATSNPTVPGVGGFLMGYNGTTWDRLRSTTANGLAVDVTRVTGTVTVDTELTAVAALADATTNPTITNISALNSLFNGTTWDRVRSVVNAQDTTGTGIQAAGILGQLDDVSTGTVTENQFAPVRISTRRAMLVEGVASGTNLNVNIAASAATVTVDSELPAAAALADATANPTVPGVGGFILGYNGTTWDRVRTANTGRLQVDVITGGGSNASVLVDNAGFTDGTSSVTTTGYILDETAGTALTENDVAAARIDSKRAQVFVGEDATTRGQRWVISAAGALSVDSELTAPAALADATSNPTITNIAGYMLGYNGTTWDRVRTANTGRLQVDVVSGGGTAAASELPALYNMIDVYGTTSATAAAGTASVVTNTPANTKLVYVRQIHVSASGQTKYQLKFGATVKYTGFTSPEKLSDTVRFDPPIPLTGDGSTALTVDVTNRELSAMDLYARINAIVLA